MKNVKSWMEETNSIKYDLSERFLQFAVDGIKLFGQINKSYAEMGNLS